MAVDDIPASASVEWPAFTYPSLFLNADDLLLPVLGLSDPDEQSTAGTPAESARLNGNMTHGAARA